MNCKPGDLAIVIQARRTPENIGRIVEVVRSAFHLELFQSIEGPVIPLDSQGKHAWVVRAATPLAWRTDMSGEFHCFEVPTIDAYLRPVSGLPINDEVKDDIKEPA